MIVQRAAPDAQHFIMTMDQHTAFAGELVALFGNDDFEPVTPREEMLYVVAHHDAGWRDLDDKAIRDPDTQLPYHLVATPMEEIVTTSRLSPDFNSARHAYCGLISSMHSWGLYNGRYGMSDKVLLNHITSEHRELVDEMLRNEDARQHRLNETLTADPITAKWIEEPHLFQNYKQLQFFDTLSLYFHCTPEGERGTTVFNHVPQSVDNDIDVRIAELDGGRYTLDPYPFAEEEVAITFEGRWLAPVPEDVSVREALYQSPLAQQTIRLCRHD